MQDKFALMKFERYDASRGAANMKDADRPSGLEGANLEICPLQTSIASSRLLTRRTMMTGPSTFRQRIELSL